MTPSFPYLPLTKLSSLSLVGFFRKEAEICLQSLLEPFLN
jgi:hypothetical protein